MHSTHNVCITRDKPQKTFNTGKAALAKAHYTFGYRIVAVLLSLFFYVIEKQSYETNN